jgi:integrase
MLGSYRRHLKSCPDRHKGQHFSLCQCPIWGYGELNGKPFRQSLRTTDSDRANHIMNALEAGRDPYWLQTAAATTPTQRTIGTAVTAFLEACGQDNEQSTIKVYRTALKHLDGAVPLEMANVDFLDAHHAKRRIAKSTWRKELRILRTFFNWCMERDWISVNPAKKLKLPPLEELKTQPFTEEDVSKMLAACDAITCSNSADTPYTRKRARALVLVLLYSGLRVSDVAKLERSALENSGHLVLKVKKTRVSQKLSLNQDAIAALKALPAISTTYFFWNGNSKLASCIHSIARTVGRLGKIAGVHAHPHRFRDTFAVALLTEGADIRTVQKLLGHKSVRTTELHYLHFVPEHQARLDAATSQLDFGPKPGRPLLLDTRHHRRRNA